MIFFKRHGKTTDHDLMILVHKGDDGAFEELLRRYQDPVYGFALKMTGDAQEAEDVAQDTFLRLYNMAGRYRPDASLKTFILRITRNLCIDHFRKKRPELMEELPELPMEHTPLDLLEKAIDSRTLDLAIEKLPPNQRAALLLRHFEAMKYAEIAETLDLTVSAVESLLVRARRKLHGFLA